MRLPAGLLTSPEDHVLSSGEGQANSDEAGGGQFLWEAQMNDVHSYAAGLSALTSRTAPWPSLDPCEAGPWLQCRTRRLAYLRRGLESLARSTMPLSAPPPRKTRFGSPLVLSRVHWVEPQLVAEITSLSWRATDFCAIPFPSGFGPTSRQVRCEEKSKRR
jgi:hypothetical protein